MAKSSQGKCVIKDEFLERQWCLDSGVLAGCLSLALLTIGTSVSLPFYQGRRDELGCDALCYGTMTSTTSFLSLCGSTLIGWMSDSPRIGRHTCLYLGITSSMFGFIVSYFNPNSLIGMWISILPAALFQQNYSVLKALFSDYHENLMKASFGDESTLSLITQSRTDSVGKLGMAVGFAFMIGSFIGGTMLRNHTESMYYAMACVLLSGLFILLIPSPKLAHHCTSGVQTNIANSSICNNKSSFDLLKQRILTPFHVLPEPCMFILIIRIFMALAYNIFNTIWTVALRRRFNFGPKEHGKFMAFVGFSYAVAQGFLAKHVIAAFGPRKSNSHKYLLMMCCLILGLGRWYVYHTNNITCLYAIFTAIVSGECCMLIKLLRKTKQLETHMKKSVPFF
jgi:MFS family permease